MTPLPDPSSSPQRGEPPTLRVLAYNVRSLRQSQTLAPALVRRLSPDVALLAETPRFVRWRSRLAAFARRADLTYGAGGGPALGGTALLTGLRVDTPAVTVIHLPKHPRLPHRGAAVAVVTLAGVRVLCVSVHLSLDRRERVAHAHELLTHLDALRHQHQTPHLIVAGDFNERPDGATWALFADAGLRDAWSAAPPAQRGGELTFPAHAPDRRIDGVLVSAGLTVDWAGVPDEMSDLPYARASDHRPVLAVLRLPAG